VKVLQQITNTITSHEHGWCGGKERNDENGKLKKEKP
jgi:hypothetical protein